MNHSLVNGGRVPDINMEVINRRKLEMVSSVVLPGIQDLAHRQKFADCVVVSKEGLELPAHKVVLSRDPFFYNLFRDTNHSCNSCPTTTYIMMPDFDYSTIAKMLTVYYTGKHIARSATEAKLFQALVNSFNKISPQDKDDECSYCGQMVRVADLINHITEHVRDCARRDRESLGRGTYHSRFVRCSYRGLKNCDEVDKNREKFSNGFFQNNGHQDKDDLYELVNEHYRKHLKEDLLEWSSRSCLNFNSFDSYYLVAEIQRSEADPSDNQSNYSGGLSSPTRDLPVSPAPAAAPIYSLQQSTARKRSLDFQSSDSEGSDKEAVSKNSTTKPRSRTKKKKTTEVEVNVNPVLKRRGSSSRRATSEDENERPRASSKASTRSSEGDLTTCSICSRSFKAQYFTKHLASHHLAHLWEEDERERCENLPVSCKYPTCKQKFQQRKTYIIHLATKHHELAEKLKEQGQSLADYEKTTDNPSKPDIRLSLDSAASDKLNPQRKSFDDDDNTPHCNDPAEIVVDIDGADELLGGDSDEDTLEQTFREREDETEMEQQEEPKPLLGENHHQEEEKNHQREEKYREEEKYEEHEQEDDLASNSSASTIPYEPNESAISIRDDLVYNDDDKSDDGHV